MQLRLKIYGEIIYISEIPGLNPEILAIYINPSGIWREKKRH